MKKRILVISPHTDDGELGCGGTINTLIRLGNDVFYVALSHKFEGEDLYGECEASMKRLGIDTFQLRDFPARNFSDHRQMILDYLLHLKDKYSPDIICVPSASDFHQDHVVVYNEAVRAFKHSTILGYDLPWCRLVQSGTYFYDISESTLATKIEALGMYKSQKDKLYMKPDYIKAMAIYNGVKMGTKYAECFETIRVIEKGENNG